MLGQTKRKVLGPGRGNVFSFVFGTLVFALQKGFLYINLCL